MFLLPDICEGGVLTVPLQFIQIPDSSNSGLHDVAIQPNSPGSEACGRSYMISNQPVSNTVSSISSVVGQATSAAYPSHLILKCASNGESKNVLISTEVSNLFH